MISRLPDALCFHTWGAEHAATGFVVGEQMGALDAEGLAANTFVVITSAKGCGTAVDEDEMLNVSLMVQW